MQQLKNIILDYGNVIFAIDFKRTQQAFKNLGIENVESFFAHKGHHSLFDQLETGDITADEFRKGIREIANRPDLTDEQIDNAWNSLLIGVEPETHEVLNKLKQQYNLFLLSNTNEIHYAWIMEYLKAEHGLEDNSGFFIKDYYSHLIRLRKPHANIFEYVLKQHGLDPAETLFIDDTQQHVNGAKSTGMQALLMTEHPAQLGRFLAQHGILK